MQLNLTIIKKIDSDVVKDLVWKRGNNKYY